MDLLVWLLDGDRRVSEQNLDSKSLWPWKIPPTTTLKGRTTLSVVSSSELQPFFSPFFSALLGLSPRPCISRLSVTTESHSQPLK